MHRLKNRENRYIARRHREVRAAILEMHCRSLRHRAWEIEYEEWTKTPEYEEETRRLEELIRQVNAELAEE